MMPTVAMEKYFQRWKELVQATNAREAAHNGVTKAEQAFHASTESVAAAKDALEEATQAAHEEALGELDEGFVEAEGGDEPLGGAEEEVAAP